MNWQKEKTQIVIYAPIAQKEELKALAIRKSKSISQLMCEGANLVLENYKVQVNNNT